MSHMIRRLRSQQQGFALIPAMAVMTLLLITASAVAMTVETETREGRRERARESNFQLAEGVLNSQIFRMSKRWPGTADLQYPLQCPGATVAETRLCPDTAALSGSFNNVDQGSWSTVTWKTEIRDDSGLTPDNRNFWTDALLAAAPRWDANNNQRMWARAEATVRGRTRVLVALIKAEILPSSLVPNQTLVAGWFRTTNQGSGQAKDFVSNGDNGGSVIVRCGTGGALGANSGDACADWNSDKFGSTISPERVYSDPAYPNGFNDPNALEQLRERALQEGNLYTGCPPTLQGQKPGQVVYIENAGSGCDYQSNGVWNSATQPGAVVIERGGPIVLRGTLDFYGMIYHANVDDASLANGTVLVKLNGNARVIGGIVVDGYKGGVEIGSSGQGQLVYSPNAGAALTTFGTAGIVQNSFREITPPTRVVAR